MIKQLDKQIALKKAQNICSKQEKCKADIRQKLYEWKVNPNYHLWVLDQLEKDKFIDDERYTGFFVRDKFKFNKWGKIKIEYELKSKQIPAEFIQAALETIDESSYIEACEYLLQQKLRALKEEERSKIKEKLFRFMQSRGFEPDLVFKLTEKILNLQQTTKL